MGETKIEWADYTFNPWIGCTKVSAGCAHCYAERDFDKRRKFVQWGPGNPRKRTSEANWKKPRAWNRQAEKDGMRRRVFCASLADVFDEEVSDAWRLDLFQLIRMTLALDWLLLTKRPEKMRLWFQTQAMPLNIWAGVSVEDQATADERIPVLLSIPAAVRWVSYEPALGEVDFKAFLPWIAAKQAEGLKPPLDSALRTLTDVPGLDWIVVGGESGPHARPFDIQWARDTIRQCRDAGVAVFVKQLGEDPRSAEGSTYVGREVLVSHDAKLRLQDRKGGDPSEWPEDLRVREFPKGAQ